MAPTRVQLCGRLAVTVGGARVERDLPGRQGRLLFAFLVRNRLRTPSREEAVAAVWPDGHDGGLAPLLSKLRRVAPLDGLRIGVDWVDVECAVDALHRAESALAQHDPRRAWGPAQVAMFVSGRTFMAGDEAPWLDDERRSFAGMHLRALEAYGAATLAIGGTELAAAVRVGRELAAREPYRESGHRILIEALDRQGNCAEALLVYEELRQRLRDDLGVSPSDQTQELHRRLLR